MGPRVQRAFGGRLICLGVHGEGLQEIDSQENSIWCSRVTGEGTGNVQNRNGAGGPQEGYFDEHAGRAVEIEGPWAGG